MEGHTGPAGVRFAHRDSSARLASSGLWDREAREAAEAESLSPGATPATGAGLRAMEEAPDPWRTCFERDRDRVLHSPAFRRLAGKTQVFVFPADHQRTRLTHALEVAQVATAIARACRLNVSLAEAIALGHDCGHGPGGHASEDALSPFVPAASTMPSGGPITRPPRSTCAPRRSTGSGITPGHARRRARRKVKSSLSPTGSPTPPTTSRTPSRRRGPPAGSSSDGGGPLREHEGSQLRSFISDVVETTVSQGRSA